MRKAIIALSGLALLAAGCDPEAPVQSSDVAAEIDGKIAVHAADSNTHGNLLVPAANVSGEFDGDQIEDGSIGIADLGSGSVGSDEIADQSIALADMGAGSVGALQLADDSVTTAKLAPNAVTAAEIAAGAVSGGAAGAIADDTINSADIQNQSIIALDIGNDTLTGAQIAADAIGATELANNAVDAAALQTDSVTAAKIAADAVTSAKIMDANVTAAKLADDAVTSFGGKLSVPDVLGSGTMGAFTTAFTMRVPNNGTVIRVVAGCESDKAMSMLRLQDNNQMIDVTCPDTNLMGPMSLFILEVTTNMAAEDVLFRYKSEANGDTTRWRIFSVTAQ